MLKIAALAAVAAAAVAASAGTTLRGKVDAKNGNPIRVTCVGDSITAGVCSKNSGGYPKLLQGILGANYVVGNFGNSGKTMLTDGLCGPPPGGNCSYVSTPTYPAALASNPDIVTIMLGTNDAKNFNWFGVQSQGDNYTVDYLNMIATFQALPSKPKIYVALPPPLFSPYPYQMNSTVINVTFPVLLPAIASAGGAAGVIDVYTAMKGQAPNITCDGCHPTDAGYQIIAQTFASALAADGWEF